MKNLLLLITTLFSFSAVAQNLDRGELVKVLSPTKIKVQAHGSKKTFDLELKGVSTKGLSVVQMKKAKKFLEYKTKNQVLIWKTDDKFSEVKIGGVTDLSKEMLEWGLLKTLETKEDSPYFRSQSIGKLRKEGIWSKSPSGK